LCELLAHHSAVVNVRALFIRSRERQGLLYQMKKPYVKVLFHNLSTDLSATLSTELWIKWDGIQVAGTQKPALTTPAGHLQ
jgi:hypothetical protein